MDEYFDYQDSFQSKYGDNTIVLMEVGSFFEIYGTDDEKDNKGKIRDICELTSLTMSKKREKANILKKIMCLWQVFLIIVLKNGKIYF